MKYAELRFDPAVEMWTLCLKGNERNRSSGTFWSNGVEQSHTQAEILLARWGYTLGAIAWMNIDGVWLVPVVPTP